MEKQLIEKVEKAIEPLIKNDIDYGNVEVLYKLTKIRHMAKEDENMYGNYGTYGRPGYDSYGRYRDSYGRRGYDAKYRGYDYLDRLGDHYGRYMDGRERYGANEETRQSLKQMLECMESFARAIKEDAQSPEEIQMVRETAQRIAQM